MSKIKLSFPCAYRVTFTGSRKPAVIIADGMHSAISKAMILCKHDETYTEVISITYVDVVVY